jgi:YbbR domain-containing protein
MTQDRAVLMICIGIALVFWFLNKLSTSYRQTQTLKIHYNLPKGKAFSSSPPQYISATFQGTGWDLLFGRNEKIEVNMTNDSLQFYSLRNLLIQQFGSDVVGVNIDQVTLRVEEAVTKAVPVEAVSNISFAPGFDLSEDIILTPSVVNVSGPRSAIQTLVSARTDTLKFFKLKDSVLTKITLAQSPLLIYDVDEVQALIKVQQFTEKSMFIPIVVNNAPENLKIFPNKIKLDCSVALNQYEKLSASNFVAEVSLSGLSAGSKNNTIPITLTKYPSFVRNIKFTPKSAEFYLEK